MDSDNFFGFDTSIPVDEDGELDDDEYDALNEETFGSAAVGGDWEENHKQLSSLKEAEHYQLSSAKETENFHRFLRLDHHSQNEKNCEPKNLHTAEDLSRTLEDFGIGIGNGHDNKKRLYERAIEPFPYTSTAQDSVSSSPSSNSIWNPKLELQDFLENLHHVKKPSTQCNNFNNTQLSYDGAQMVKSDRTQGIRDLKLSSLRTVPSTVKTVSELEEELKYQGAQKLGSMSGEEFERELHRVNNISELRDLVTIGNRNGNRYNPHPNYHLPNMGGLGMRPNSPHVQLNGTNHRQLNNFSGSGVGFNQLQFSHPVLNNVPVRNLPPGLLSNSNLLNKQQQHQHHHINQTNHRGSPNAGFYQGRNVNRSYNDRKNFDQNNRYEQSRKEKNGNQGTNRIRRDSDAEWEEWQRIRQIDEYCGLMTPSEKSWLRNIQAMQLQTENPYQDDYYYVMHNAKQQNRHKEEIFESIQLLWPEKGKEGKDYEPPRLENSLGKLQVVSVNAPRKIIDLQVVHLDSSHPTTSLQRDMRKHRHLLLYIEKLYNTQIELDDLQRKIRALPDCPTRDSFRSKCKQLVSKLWVGLIRPHESFVQTLCIRKGKTLASRLMSWLSQPEVEHLLATITQNLSLLTKKDVYDKRLPLFWPFADRFFSNSSPSTVVSFGIMMGPQLKEHKKPFMPAISSKLGVSMILSLLVRGEDLSSDLEGDEAWQQFLKDVILSLSSRRKRGEDSAGIEPLPSVNFAVAGQKPINQILKCRLVDPGVMKEAVDVLKTIESRLSSTSPSVTSLYALVPTQEQRNPNHTYTNSVSKH